MSALEPCPRIAELEAEVERLRCALNLGQGGRYWEGRWRDEAAENERLRAALGQVTYTYNPISMDGSHALLMYEIANAALTPKEPTP